MQVPSGTMTLERRFVNISKKKKSTKKALQVRRRMCIFDFGV